jgi:hypothetical protein
MEVDLVLVKGEWYILEINNRWSGLTTLITASRGLLPYDVYMDEATGAEFDFNDVESLKFSCQFKMPDVDADTLAKIAAEPPMKSVIQYDVRMPGKDPFTFNDAVVGGFASLETLLDGFADLQKKYPEQIPEALVSALREKEMGN